MNKLKHFTMEEVDAEIMQIVQQQGSGDVGASGSEQPNIIKSILNRAKSGKRDGANATAQAPKL
jgi:hypothetical protein